MRGNHRAQGMITRWDGGKMRWGACLLSLSLLVAWGMGCREPAATPQKSTVEAQKPTATAQKPVVESRPETPAPVATSKPTVPPATETAAPAKSVLAEPKPVMPARSETPAPVAKPQAQEPKPVPAETMVKIVRVGESRPAGDQPKIAVENDTCDLGDIGLNTKHKGQFKFTNTGKAPLKISQVTACCGVVVKGVEAGQEFAPGRGGALEFDYLAPDVPNPMLVKKLYLETNDPNQSRVTLSIKATIVRRVICKPELLRLFLKKPNAGCPELALTSLNGKPFSIASFKATGNAITAAFDPNAKETEYVLKPQVDAAKLEQNMRGQISIDVTHPDCNNVRVMYDTLPEFEVSTATIMMFGLKAGQAVQREFWVLNNYEETFEIESVSSLKGTIKLVDKTMTGNRCRLRVEMTPPERGPDTTVASDTLEIRIKNKKDPVTISFRGFYQ